MASVAGPVVGRVLLGGEQDEGVGPHPLLEREDRLLASDEEGRDHVRKYDEVAQWQHRRGSGFTWRKRWAWLRSGHGPKSVLWFLNTVVSRLDDKRLGPILGPIPAGPRSAGGAMKPPLGEPVPAFTPSTRGWRGAFLASRSSVAVRCSC